MDLELILENFFMDNQEEEIPVKENINQKRKIYQEKGNKLEEKVRKQTKSNIYLMKNINLSKKYATNEVVAKNSTA